MPDPAAPHYTSTTLAIVQPTPSEIKTQAEKNSVSWRGALSHEAYLRREVHLANQSLTKESGLTFWVLVSTAVAPSQRKVLAGCETIRKRAIIASDGHVRDVICHGVASVFVPPEYRGRNYGWRLIDELSRKLHKWQGDKAECRFSILYSDIGKEFYNKHGWRPYQSSHVHLLPSTANHPLPPTVSIKLLIAADLPALSTVDESLIRGKLTAKAVAQASTKPHIAVLPDAATLAWHHAREEFVAGELLGRAPIVKGALATVNGHHRVWAIWVRVFLNGNPKANDGNTLHILRLCIENEHDTSDAANADHVAGIVAVLRAAQKDAADWHCHEVELWNPHPLTLEACREIAPTVETVHRDVESIASLKWFGGGSEGMEVEWCENEKFAWC